MFVHSILLLLVTSLTSTHALTPDQRNSMRSFINSLMDCRDIVGMSIAMVKDREVVFSEGFGHRDLESNSTMDSQTKINIGSLTKAMTAAMAADAVAKDLIDWDTPLQDVLGKDFKLEGEFRSEQVNIKDILAHTLGMPSYWGFTSTAPNVSRQDLVMKRMRHFPTLYGFRSHYIYANYPYILAGYVLEVLTGQTWEEQIRKILFEPLNMTDTKHVAELTEDDWNTNTAYSYTDVTGELLRNPEQQMLPVLEKVSPAGGVFSSANDMAKWMLFILSHGKDTQGREVIPAKTLKELFVPVSTLPGQRQISKPTFPVGHFDMAYGLGFKIGSYRGREKLRHTGAYTGYKCWLSLVPAEQAGVWLCINSPGDRQRGSATIQLTQMYALDLLLDEEPWLNDTTACTFPHPWIPQEDKSKNLEKKATEKKNKTEKKSVGYSVNNIGNCTEGGQSNLTRFVGDYGHLAFGIFKVFIGASTCLRYEIGTILKGDLKPTNDTMTFLMTLDEPMTNNMVYYPDYSEGFPVYFEVNEAGDVISSVKVPYIEFKLPPTFERGVQLCD